MKRFRNIILIALVLIMCLGVLACKNGDKGTTNEEASEISKEEKTETEKTDDKDKKTEKNDTDAENTSDEKDNNDELYQAMAKDLAAMNIKEDNKAFVVSLGAGYDEETLKDVLSRLKIFKDKYEYEKDFEELFMLVNADDTNKRYLMAQEFYLLIPKYDDAQISLKELELTEEGKLEPIANENLDGKVAHGPTLICQNISDIAPNGEITIKDIEGETKFSPFVSLKDGALMLDGKVFDASEVLSIYEENDDYDKDLFEKINAYIPKF